MYIYIRIWCDTDRTIRSICVNSYGTILHDYFSQEENITFFKISIFSVFIITIIYSNLELFDLFVLIPRRSTAFILKTFILERSLVKDRYSWLLGWLSKAC